MGPFGLGDGAFDNNMIDLPIIVSLLPLGNDRAAGGLLWRNE
jgi:hypothetical protein